ncbi:MAG: serine/threonine protein kinase [Candidatus Wallbacteria bacterium]|nr:serine/threonine protein kinase [Candidatus Wallbacteria bacterium]
MPAEGDKLGRHLLREKLGQGGMGIVYLATHETLGREVALKLMPEPQAGAGAGLARRFLREASACSRLSHPSIVKVFDFGHEHGFYYYSMEVLRARSLEEVLRDGTPAPLELTFRVARDMAGAMQHYHAAGLVHRDIKPANIVLHDDGRPVLTDFGLVKDLEATAITRQGLTVGTPHYMAPEMIYGEVFPSSDIWQLGVVLYRMCTGKLPFPGEQTEQVLTDILQTEPVAPVTLNDRLPASLSILILNCLEKSTSLRYSNADELARDVAAAARRATVARRHAPAKAEEPAPKAAAPGPSRAGRASAPVVRPDPKTVPRVGLGPKAWLTLAALALAVAGWYRVASIPSRATEIVCRAGSRRALVSWKSSPATVEWGTIDAAELRVAHAETKGDVSSVELAPLEPGNYRFSLVLPDGSRSPSHQFTVPATAIRPMRFACDEKGLELGFVTPHATRATLSDGRGRTVQDVAATTAHLLRLESPVTGALLLGLEFPDPAGDPVRLDGQHFRDVFIAALLEPMARELAATLAAYDPAPFLLEKIDKRLPATVCRGLASTFTKLGFEGMLLGVEQDRMPHYERFGVEDPLARKLAAELSTNLSGQPWHRPLRSLLALAPDLWSRRRLSKATALALHPGLQRLAAVDYYAGFLGVPAATGVETILADQWQSGYRRALASSVPSIVLSVPQDIVWPYPMEDARLLRDTSLQIQGKRIVADYDFDLPLEAPDRCKRAEVTLHSAHLETELTFRVEFVGGPTLDLRHESRAQVQNPERFPRDLSLLLDPRLLQTGKNRVRISVAPVAGTRYLALKPNNSLRAFRFAWEP